MNKKILNGILLLLIISLTIAYLKIGPPAKTDEIKVICPPSIIASLPIWIAEEKLFFKNNNIKINLIDVTNSKSMVESLVAKNADILPAVSLVDMTNIGGAGNIALMHAKIYSHSRMKKNPSFESLLISTNSDIKSLKDLEGKRIAVYPGKTSEAVVKSFLEKSGVKTNTINFISLPPPEHEAALSRDDVQAIHVYEPFRSLALQNLKTRELSGSIYAHLNEPSGIGCSAISRDFLRNNPNAADKFLNAWDESIKYINEHPKEAREILSKRLSLPESVAEKSTWVDATSTKDTNYETLFKTISSIKEAGAISQDFVLEKDMVLTR